jgi:phage/plasmid-like protein (TIGR03299 family)
MTTVTQPGSIEMIEDTRPASDTAATQVSSRLAPWMKLGELADGVMTSTEAAQLGGLDFKVREDALYSAQKVDGKPPKFSKITGRKVLVNEDNGEWLGIVSTGYPVVQYSEAFDFMDGVSPHFVAAGALRGGKQGFMVVKTDAKIKLDDEHELFAVLRTSHDSSRAIEVMVMPLRGKCMNQLTLRSFSKGVDHRWAITHTGDVKAKLAAAHDAVKKLSTYARSYESNAQRLQSIKVSDEVTNETLRRVLPDRPKRPEVIQSILSNYHNRPETVGYEGTGWGLVNAVSEYFEWDRALGTPESRFLAALQGQTHNAINKTAGYILSRA